MKPDRDPGARRGSTEHGSLRRRPVDRRRVRSGVAGAFATATLLAGCTVSSPEPADPPDPSAAVGSTSRATPTEAAPPTAGDLPLTDAGLQWHSAAPPSMDVQTVAAVTPDRMVVVMADTSGQRLVVVGDGFRAERAVPPDQVVQNVFLIGEDVVFDSAAPWTDDYWITRWSPATDGVDLIHSATGDDAWFSETAVDGTDLYLTRPGDGGTRCIDRMDVAAAEPAATTATVTCAPADLNIGWLKITDGTLTFLAGTTETACAAVHRIALPSGADKVVAVDGCPSRVIATPGSVIWTEEPAADPDGLNYSTVPLRVQVGATVHELGTAVAGSTVVCDGTLYWTWLDPDAPSREPEQIRRWVPGGPVEIAYDQADRGRGQAAYTLSGPICGHGVTAFQRFRSGTDAGQELMTDVPLRWSADLRLTAP